MLLFVLMIKHDTSTFKTKSISSISCWMTKIDSHLIVRWRICHKMAQIFLSQNVNASSISMEIPMSLTCVCKVNKAQHYWYIYPIVSVLHTTCRLYDSHNYSTAIENFPTHIIGIQVICYADNNFIKMWFYMFMPANIDGQQHTGIVIFNAISPKYLQSSRLVPIRFN